MALPQETIIDWERFAQARAHLGGNFVRVVGYFREDGKKFVDTIEEALKLRNPIRMIAPADSLKSDALQLGALTVAELAEDIEFAARDCVEFHQDPDLLMPPVLQLREAFGRTLVLLDRDVNPLLARRSFG
jgi:histidine phosphotransfer protein HptB